MSQQAKRYQPRKRNGIRNAITAQEYAREVYCYQRKAG